MEQWCGPLEVVVLHVWEHDPHFAYSSDVPVPPPRREVLTP